MICWFKTKQKNKKIDPFIIKTKPYMTEDFVCFTVSVQVLVKSGFTVFPNVPTY